MEKNRIYHAALGWLIIQLWISFSAAGNALGQYQPDVAYSDTTEPPLRENRGDTLGTDARIRGKEEVQPGKGREKRAAEEAVDTLNATIERDTIAASPYDRKDYISRGPGDELRHLARYYFVTSGNVGQPELLYRYLNVAGEDVTINGLPFVYGGMYRPYLAGFDVDVLPWEIIGDIESGNGVLDFSLGVPRSSPARSDVEVSRWPYGYSGTRWRFMQPVGSDIQAYFTVGFKKSNGYFPNTDYDGFHVTGGMKTAVLGAVVELDIWQHRARYGLNSFGYLVPQLLRQSRGIRRYELRFKRPLAGPVSLRFAGTYQRSSKTVSGYGEQIKTKYDLGGGRGSLRLDLGGYSGDAGVAYYNIKLFGLQNRRPNVNQFEYFAKFEGNQGNWHQTLNLEYAWDGTDHGAFLPEMRVSYSPLENLGLFAELSRSRRLPDLFLLYFDDRVTGLGVGQTLESYEFDSKSDLRMPVYGALSFGLDSPWRALDAQLTVSEVRIDDQIRLAYQADTNGNVVVTPLNFDDRYLEFEGKLKGSLGPLSGEVSGVYRKWNERYFGDGLEKGPAAIGFGRLSFLRQFFIKDLFLGGSLEVQASSRRDYRSIQIGYADGYTVFNGRLEFRYEDFTFWLNEDNLLNTKYYSLWPYPERPRTVWWNFRWKFFG